MAAHPQVVEATAGLGLAAALAPVVAELWAVVADPMVVAGLVVIFRDSSCLGCKVICHADRVVVKSTGMNG